MFSRLSGRYFNAGGKPDEVVDYLSANYDAIAQTSNLLAEWLLMTDINISEVQTSVEENLKKMIIKYFDPKKADSIFSDAGVSRQFACHFSGFSKLFVFRLSRYQTG